MLTSNKNCLLIFQVTLILDSWMSPEYTRDVLRCLLMVTSVLRLLFMISSSLFVHSLVLLVIALFSTHPPYVVSLCRLVLFFLCKRLTKATKNSKPIFGTPCSHGQVMKDEKISQKAVLVFSIRAKTVMRLDKNGISNPGKKRVYVPSSFMVVHILIKD